MKLSAAAKVTQHRYGTRSQAAPAWTGRNAAIVAAMESQSATISAKARSGRRSPKKIADHAAFNASCTA